MSLCVAGVIGGLIDLLIPPTCCICRTLLDQSESMICPECLEMLEPLELPVCELCGQPDPNNQPCLSCQNTKGLKIKIRSSLVFEGICKDAILALKLGGKTQLAPVLAKLVARTDFQGFDIRDCELLVPVPLHRSRLLQRGFNQAALIAHSLSDIFGIPTESRRLKKHKKTPSQHTVQNKKKRLQNVKGSFKVSSAQPFVKKKCCLVDDVVTTGSTLTACAEALFEAGAISVVGVTVARTLSYCVL